MKIKKEILIDYLRNTVNQAEGLKHLWVSNNEVIITMLYKITSDCIYLSIIYDFNMTSMKIKPTKTLRTILIIEL